MRWIEYIPMGIAAFILFFGYIGTIVCLVREQRAWKRQKIKDSMQYRSTEKVIKKRNMRKGRQGRQGTG